MFNINNFTVSINRDIDGMYKAEIKGIKEIIKENNLESLFIRILKVINRTISFPDYLINNSD